MWLNKRVALVSWRIPGMGEPGGLLSLGLHRVRHDWGDLAVAVHNNTGILQPEVGGGWRDLRNTVENSLNCHEFLLESGLGQGGWWGHRNKWGTIQFSRSVVSESLRPHESQHAKPSCPSPTPGVHSDLRSLSQWFHPAISSSVVPFFSCPQSLPASKSFPMSQLFAWGGQSTGVSASASFFPKKSHGWSPSEWTGWISLQSKGLSRVFSNTTVQKHQFFGAQLSSQSNSHINTWSQEKP